MIEIFILYQLCKKVGAIVRAKGHTAFGYQLLVVLLWFGGEITGGVVGAVFSAVSDPTAQEPSLLFVYLFAIAGAALGAGAAFLIANSLADRSGKSDEEFYRPEPAAGADDDYRRRFGDPVRQQERNDITAEPDVRPRRLDDRVRE